MAWDTDATREKLLDAAIAEFSERGFAGARIHQISGTSGCNRERIYFYFGGKAQLFEAALTRQLATALEDLPVTLCHAWVSTPNVHAVITRSPDGIRRRASIMRTAELVARDAEGAGPLTY